MTSKSFVPPNHMKNLRACMVCAYLTTGSNFRRHGCPNCEFLEMQGSDEAHVNDCTSAVYEGVIFLQNPTDSWVAKWQRLDGYVPGSYAVKVSGILGEEQLAACEGAGVRYIPRDGSEQEELGEE
ncbi:Spt4/RpoE2 zinc finger-domain-containing protein [Phyllosticta capitalensis]|uniref:Transcription elongation factor SPT4 n=1 Tax=Phyllosticta capitalensis TaxID=121624 RepID=A0ABR1Z442_9PEZI